MTGKERAALRAQANSLDPLFQVGKGGVSDAVIAQARQAIEKKELIKLKVLLDSSPDTPRRAADAISFALGADVVQVIGGSIVLYKYNPELHKPEKKPVRKPAVKAHVKKSAVGAKRQRSENGFKKYGSVKGKRG